MGAPPLLDQGKEDTPSPFNKIIFRTCRPKKAIRNTPKCDFYHFSKKYPKRKRIPGQTASRKILSFFFVATPGGRSTRPPPQSKRNQIRKSNRPPKECLFGSCCSSSRAKPHLEGSIWLPRIVLLCPNPCPNHMASGRQLPRCPQGVIGEVALGNTVRPAPPALLGNPQLPIHPPLRLGRVWRGGDVIRVVGPLVPLVVTRPHASLATVKPVRIYF